MTEVLRTPEDRFENLPDYPFEPHFLDGLPGFDGVRVHYVDEGEPTADSVYLCLHGHPTWSYLFRRMIPIFAHHGHRVVAPDLPGFGKSDKPANESAYSFEALRDAVIGFIETLDLQNITLVMHDWGASLGLTLPHSMPDRIRALVVMNSWLATGDREMPNGVVGWRVYNESAPDLNVPGLMAKANRILTFGECRAYGAPYPGTEYKAALRALPPLLAQGADDPGAEIARDARHFLATEWDGASQVVIAGRDPVVGHTAMRRFAADLRGTPRPMFLDHAGHFVPEWGDEFAEPVMKSLADQEEEKARLAAEMAAEDPDSEDKTAGAAG